MKMNKSTKRSRRHRDAQQSEGKEQQPFFSKSNNTPPIAIGEKKEDAAFFQPKLTIGEPNDKYEQEADAVADSVVNQSANQSANSPAVQSKEISSIQRYMTNAKEDEMGTNTERMEKDKAIQEKPEVQRMEDEEPVQKKEEEEPEVQTKEDEEMPVQKMEEEETPEMQTKEEEEPVQKMEEEEEADLQAKEEEESVQKMEEKEPELQTQKEEEEASNGAIQAKDDQDKSAEKTDLTTQLQSTKGQGSPLPEGVLQKMSQTLGYDFSKVRIHTGGAAEAMAKQLGAQAFTHGTDIYFNAGRYNPTSKAGLQLLSHELTHVVQQKGKD